MKGLVGAEGVQSYLQQNDPASNDINPDLSSFNYFNAAHASIIPKLTTQGMKLSGGFWNPDESGFLFSGGYQFQDTSTFDARKNALANRLDTTEALRFQRAAGLGNPSVFNLGGRTDLDLLKNGILAPGTVFDATDTVSYGTLGSTFEILDRTLLNLYGIPTTSGVVNGEVEPFDVDYILKQTIASGGAYADWAFSPMYDNDRIKVRAVVGGRWLWIDETFKFNGTSTWLAYNSQGATADGDTPVNAKVFLPDTGVLPTTTTVGTYTAPLGINDLLVRAYIKSQVITNLYGPEMGLHYELGNRKGIQVTGSTRVAAMFNSETLRLEGDNIGNFTGIEVVPDPVTGANIASRMYDTSTRQGPSLNAFKDVSVGTHISPLFEQSFTAEIPIFDRVPVLRNVSILDGAKFSVGWTGLVVGQVADPVKSIVWDSSPISNEFLHYRPNRKTFVQNSLNLGINWTY